MASNNIYSELFNKILSLKNPESDFTASSEFFEAYETFTKNPVNLTNHLNNKIKNLKTSFFFSSCNQLMLLKVT